MFIAWADTFARAFPTSTFARSDAEHQDAAKSIESNARSGGGAGQSLINRCAFPNQGLPGVLDDKETPLGMNDVYSLG